MKKRRKILGLLISILVFSIFGTTLISGIRLPTVGSDTDNWGTILNNFLVAEHNSDGTHSNITAYSINLTGDFITRNPYVDVRAFGAKGDGATDDTIAIQAAIDYAQTFAVNNARVPIVYFPSGEYIINDTIAWKTANLVGTFPNTGVRIYWNGESNTTAITKNAGYAGGASFALMSGLNFRSGTNSPSTWLNVTTTADKFFILDTVHFGDSFGDAIQFQGWVNLHLTHLRFDGPGGYAIRLTVPASQNLASFVLDKFTYDHHGNKNGSGFIIIDNTAGVSNVGTFKVTNGRIEVNTNWSSPQAIFTIQLDDPTNARTIGLHVSDVTYQDVIGMGSDVLLYRNTTDTSGSENFIFENIRTEGLSAILNGSWPATFPNPSVPANGIITKISSQGTNIILASAQEYMELLSTSNILSSSIQGDTNNRFEIDAAGKIEWGDGSSTPDISLYRSAANTLTFLGAYILVMTREGANYIQINNDNPNSQLDFVIGSVITTGTRKMTIKQNGNVGIGTTSPTHKLNVVGDVNITEGSLILTENITAITCDAGSVGGIIYSGGKHYGCNETGWNALY